MLNSFKSFFTKRQRCGVCLFTLEPGVRSLKLDVDDYPESVFLEADSHEFTRNDLNRSSNRGCKTCQIIASSFNIHHVEFSTARWWPRRYESPYLELVEATLKYELRALMKDKPDFSATNIDINSIHPCIVPGKKVAGSTSADKCLDQAAAWLASCRQHHGNCSHNDMEFCPKRLLFLGHANEGTVKLVENPPKNTSYVALSHRWTQETLQIRLVHADLPQRQLNGIQIEDLPQMMRDVIFLLRRLGMFYIWIDCMCIIQDDQDDWRREAATMASIYANAELTVAATWCDSNGQSLFCKRDGRDYDQVDIHNADTPIFLRRILPHFTWNDLENDWFANNSFVNPELEWPLLSRGWTYQEQLLSRRILHFTRHEIIWECNSTMECECGWYAAANTIELSSLGPNKQSVESKSWVQIVKEYSKRDLTFGTDKLPAMAGVAKAFEKTHTNLGDYVCGVWEQQLEECFFWSVTDGPKQKPTPSRIPSWSWAAVSGNITCWGVSAENVEFLDMDVSYDGESFMGEVKEAKVILSGQLVPAILYHEWKGLGISSSPVDSRPGMLSSHVQIGDQFSVFRPDYRLDNHGPGLKGIQPGSSVFCLIFGRTSEGSFDPEEGVTSEKIVACFLVLTPIDETNGVFSRIGLFEGTHEDKEDCIDLETALNLSQRRKITII